MTYNKIILLILVVALMSSCGLRKASRGPTSYYQEYFIDDGVLQYFIKPLDFKADGYKLAIDFVFRDTITMSYVNCKYSMFSETVIKEIDSLIIILPSSETLSLVSQKKMFVQKKKQQYQIRYNGDISYLDMKVFLASKNPIIKVYAKDKEITLLPTRKTKKKIKLLDSDLIEIIELNK